jgi:hypothetical protein
MWAALTYAASQVVEKIRKAVIGLVPFSRKNEGQK